MILKKIINCARCGGTHENLQTKKFERSFAPSEAKGMEWTYWAPCPTNGDPILVTMWGDL